jgi:hypothetical protein
MAKVMLQAGASNLETHNQKQWSAAIMLMIKARMLHSTWEVTPPSKQARASWSKSISLHQSLCLSVQLE